MRNPILLILFLSTLIASAFDKPTATQKAAALSRANIGTTRQSDYTVVYSVPLELGGPAASGNTVALTDYQYKQWKAFMKNLVKQRDHKKISPQMAHACATTWCPKNQR